MSTFIRGFLKGNVSKKHAQLNTVSDHVSNQHIEFSQLADHPNMQQYAEINCIPLAP